MVIPSNGGGGGGGGGVVVVLLMCVRVCVCVWGREGGGSRYGYLGVRMYLPHFCVQFATTHTPS